MTHPFPLRLNFGTLAVDLGCFRFDNETYLTLSDSLRTIDWYSKFDKVWKPVKAPSLSSALPPEIYSQRLALKLFRGEPAISRFDWRFTSNHKSSPTISTGVCSVLHDVLPSLQPAHG